jgi:hypothetical protein
MQHPVVNHMLPNVSEFIQSHPLYATDEASLADWKASCKESWSLLSDEFLTEEERAYGTSILSIFVEAYENLARHVAAKKHSSATHWSTAERLAAIQHLLEKPQIEQRTEEWYQEAATLLSASQFSTILKSGRTRGQLVLQKVSPDSLDTRRRQTCVLTEALNPFTWGIRFEPIVKQIYQSLTATRVVELGRLRHPTDSRLAASPDGLVVEGPEERMGRFVEFKAPVTRKIMSIVPDDYMVQMQIQMEVGGVEECDYLEVKFNSKYGAKDGAPIPENVAYYGQIYLIGNFETGEILRYEYSPLKDMSWEPTLDASANEMIIETISWWTNEWYLTTIGRSRAWFASVQPAIESFWADVDKAKRGEFQLPETTRKKKEPVCKIMVSENNEMVHEDTLLIVSDE